MAMGKHCFQITVDSLQEDGYLQIGVAKEKVVHNRDAIPSEDYNCHGYTSTGDICVCGKLVGEGKEKIRQGDEVTMVVDFGDRSIVWYRNGHAVGYHENMEGSNLCPFVIMGFSGYRVSLTRAVVNPPPIMKWGPVGKAGDVQVTKGGLRATSRQASGYAGVRTGGFFDCGNPYIEMEVEALVRDGYVLFGVGNQDVHQSESLVPVEEYNHVGYSSSGEAFQAGARVKSGLPRVQSGDLVGIRLLFDTGKVVFYVNRKPVVELSDLADYERYYPCLTFGNAGYQVLMNPTPRIPLGVPRWSPDHVSPIRFTTDNDGLVAHGLKASQCVTVGCEVEYEEGRHYFEMFVTQLHPQAEMCIGAGNWSITDNYRVVPSAEFQHVGYLNSGEIVALGKVIQTGAPRIRVPDRVGFLVDCARKEFIFFHNGFTVARYSSDHIGTRMRPCVTCVGAFEVQIDPTPTAPPLYPEWDPIRKQDDIELTSDCLTALIPDGAGTSVRTVWCKTVYNMGVLYFELSVELHGRQGSLVFGVGNANLASVSRVPYNDHKFLQRAVLPYEEYYAVGITSRGDVIISGAIERAGEEPWGSSDRVGMRIDFVSETFAVYKNGWPVVVGYCPGVRLGVSPLATFVYGPHALRIDPMPPVPAPPHRWDRELCHVDVELSNYDMGAKNRAVQGYPTIVSWPVLRYGRHYLEIVIEYLPPAGFLMLGICGSGGHRSTDRIPDAKHFHFGYSSGGDMYALGKRISMGGEELRAGDRAGLLLDIDVGTVTFYKNGYPIGYQIGIEGPRVVDGLRPCVTFGYANYSCRIDPCARLPSGCPRWDMTGKSEHVEVSYDRLTATSRSWLACPTIRVSAGYTAGLVYFEVRINYIKLGGYVAFGLGGHDIHKCGAVYPPAHYAFFAYTAHGELLRRGEKVQEGLPRLVTGDDVGLRADFVNGHITFYKNRTPVGSMDGLSGELFPAVSFANEGFSVTIHTNALERLEVPSFDGTVLPPAPHRVVLSNFGMTACNEAATGYPTVRARGRYRSGTFFFEVTVEELGSAGFMLIGVGSLGICENTAYMPPDKYNSYGLSSSGEIMALGEVESGGHRRFEQGDRVGLICNLDKAVLNFYINDTEVAEVRNLTPFMEYCPFVVFGKGPFQVTISRVPGIARILAVKERQSAETKAARAQYEASKPP